MAPHRSVWGTLGEVLVREYRRLLDKNVMIDDDFNFFKKTVMLVFESIMLLTYVLFYLIDYLFNVK